MNTDKNQDLVLSIFDEFAKTNFTILSFFNPCKSVLIRGEIVLRFS
jgi:hypothetical protein